MVEYALMITILFTAGWLVVYGKGRVWLRGLIALSLILASVGIIERIERYRGTPRTSELPEEVLVHGFLVDEGNGIIYLYCGNRPPDSLIVPYERPAHEALQQGRQKFEGKSFVMKTEGEEGEGEGKEGDGREGEEGSEGEGDGDLSTKSERKFVVELPKAVLPKK